jgi:anthranilate synthase component 1
VITELEYKSLALQGHNRIPLMAEAFADLETPLSLYLKLAFAKDGGKHSFLLESVVGGERFGRYSFIGLPARTWLRSRGFGDQAVTEVVKDGMVVETDHGNPLDFIDRYQKRFKVALRPGMPRFCGGLAGYFGYDTVRHIEKKLEATCPPDSLGCPDIMLLQTEELAVIDNLSGKLYLMVYTDPGEVEAYANGKKRLRELKDLLKYSVSAPALRPSASHPVEREFAKADYLKAVERAKGLIEAGDFMQVQVGQRLKKRYTESPLSLYRALRSLNPSPYMYYYHLGDFHVVGASPEILVRLEQVNVSGDAAKPEAGRKVTIRPLAGTRPRGATPELDKAIEQELIQDPKERAEHVMHIVSNVEGVLRQGLDNIDVLKATFPAGTLSGAPKVHAMELIDQLEPTKRGIYGGACGYLSFAGDMDLAIAIRTGIIKGDTLYVQAAAGVVADSVPEMEWRETEHKARALLRASELVEEGLE